MLHRGVIVVFVWLTMLLSAGLTMASVRAVPASECEAAARVTGQKRTAAQQRAYLNYMSGVTYKVAGDLHGASRAFIRCIKSDTRHYASYYQLAIIAREFGQIGAALQYSEVAYKGDSLNRDYADLYGRLLATATRYQDAERVYSVLAASDPTDSESAALWAILMMQLGQHQKALDVINSIENQRGIQSQLIDSKRRILISQNKLESAYTYLESACDEIPDLDALTYVSFADLAASLHRDSVAQANYNRAISIDPQAVMPLYSLAEYYRLKGRTAQMVESLVPLFENPEFRTKDKISYYNSNIEPLISTPDGYRKYLSSSARFAAAIYRSDSLDYPVIDFYSRYLLRCGLHDKAHDLLVSSLNAIESQSDTATLVLMRPDVRKAERLLAKSVGQHVPTTRAKIEQPGEDKSMLYNSIISLAQYRKQIDTVDHYLERAERLYPRSGAIGLTKLYVCFARGDTLAALDAAHQVISVTSNDSLRAVALGFCGDMDQMRGDTKRAFRYYEKALRNDPDNILVLNNYAYFMSLEERDLERALAMSERVNKLSVSNPTYLDTHAWILHKMGRNEEAQTIIRQAIALQSEDNPELLMHYGDILYALDKSFLAKSYWQRALDAGANAHEIEQRIIKLESTPKPEKP